MHLGTRRINLSRAHQEAGAVIVAEAMMSHLLHNWLQTTFLVHSKTGMCFERILPFDAPVLTVLPDFYSIRPYTLAEPFSQDRGSPENWEKIRMAPKS